MKEEKQIEFVKMVKEVMINFHCLNNMAFIPDRVSESREANRVREGSEEHRIFEEREEY